MTDEQDVPTFEKYDKVKYALNQIFGKTQDTLTKESVKIQEKDIEQMLSMIACTPNSVALFNGIMGIGKGRFTNALTQAMFQEDVGILQCNPNKTPEEAFYDTDVGAKTMYIFDPNNPEKVIGTDQKYEFEPKSRRIIDSPIKFFNEINRSNKSIQDMMLRILEEKEIEYKGQIFKIPDPYVTIMDQNPEHMQNDGQELEPALIDRIDVMLPMPAPNMFTSLRIQQMKNKSSVPDKITPVMDYDEMKEVFADVDKIHVPDNITFWVTCVSQMFTSCMYRRDIGNSMFVENINCETCQYNNSICSKVKYPIGQRHIESIIKLAKTSAWLDKRTDVTVEDAKFVLPFAIGHRLQMKDEMYLEYESAYHWIKMDAMPKLVNLYSSSEELFALFTKTISFNDKDAFTDILNAAKSSPINMQVCIESIHKIHEKSNMEVSQLDSINLSSLSPEQMEKIKQKISNGPTMCVQNSTSDLNDFGTYATKMIRNTQTSDAINELLANKKKIESMFANVKSTSRRFVIDSVYYSSKMYPHLAKICDNKNQQSNLSRSTSEDIDNKVGKTGKIEVEHVKNGYVKVNLTFNDSTEINKLDDVLKPIYQDVEYDQSTGTYLYSDN